MDRDKGNLNILFNGLRQVDESTVDLSGHHFCTSKLCSSHSCRSQVEWLYANTDADANTDANPNPNAHRDSGMPG